MSRARPPKAVVGLGYDAAGPGTRSVIASLLTLLQSPQACFQVFLLPFKPCRWLVLRVAGLMAEEMVAPLLAGQIVGAMSPRPSTERDSTAAADDAAESWSFIAPDPMPLEVAIPWIIESLKTAEEEVKKARTVKDRVLKQRALMMVHLLRTTVWDAIGRPTPVEPCTFASSYGNGTALLTRA